MHAGEVLQTCEAVPQATNKALASQLVKQQRSFPNALTISVLVLNEDCTIGLQSNMVAPPGPAWPKVLGLVDDRAV